MRAAPAPDMKGGADSKAQPDIPMFAPERETMARADLAALQLERLKKVLELVYDTVSHYRSAFRAAGARLDDREYGAGLLLGLNCLVTVGHGRSQRDRIYFSLRSTAQLVETRVLEQVRDAVASTVISKQNPNED